MEGMDVFDFHCTIIDFSFIIACVTVNEKEGLPYYDKVNEAALPARKRTRIKENGG